MSAPLLIRFATDHSAAKSGVQDLAASVVSSMVKVSGALNTVVEANGGWAASIKTLSESVANDTVKVAQAGVEAATKSNYSVVATAAAVKRAAQETQTGAFAMNAAGAVATEGLRFKFGLLKNEAVNTLKVLATSPTFFDYAGAATGILGLVAAYKIMDATARAASEALDSTAKIGDQASRLDVSTTFFQTYTAQARTLRVEVDDLVKSLDMAKEAFTVRLGEGSDGRNESTFGARLRQQRIAGNVDQDQVDRFNGAIGNEAKYKVSLEIMSELQAKAKDLAALDLGKYLFPPEMLDRIRSGTIEIDRLRKTIDDVKNPDLVLLKPEEIARAQELNRRLEDAQAILDKAAKEFNHEMALAGVGYKEDAIAWKELMANGARGAVSILQQARQYFEQQEKARPAIYGVDYFRPQDAPASGLAGDVGRPALPRATGDADMDNALNKLRGNLGNKTMLDQAQAASRRMSEGFFPDKSKTVPSQNKPRAQSDSFDAVETFINGLEKSAAAVKAEAEAFGKSNIEKAQAIALAKLKETADQQGITVTDEQIAKVKAATAASANYKDQIADLAQQQEQAAETARYFGNAISGSFADAIADGKRFSNILQDLEKMLLRSTLQALFTGQGPMAGILGMAPAASSGSNAVGGIAGLASSLFGGFRANGGPMQAGRAYTVGEMGEEMFIPNEDGRMVPISRGGGIGGAGGGPINVYNYAGEAVSATPQRRSDGGVDLLIDRVDSGLAQRVGSGRGDLASLSPGSRNLRG